MPHCKAKIQPVDSENSILAPCVLKLCEKYFKSERALKGSLAIINVIPNPSVFQRMILKRMNEDKEHVLGVMIKDARKMHLNASHVTEKAQNYFMLLSYASEITTTIGQLKSLPTWNPLAQVVVLFIDPMQSLSQQETMSQIVFNELLHHSVLNVNIIYQYSTEPFKFEVVTWFPYYNLSCASRVNNIQKIDECIVTEKTSGMKKEQQVGRQVTLHVFNQDMFPKIPKKFHDCDLKITTFVWEPFVTGRRRQHDKIESGLEILMLHTITEKMHLKPIYSVISSKRAMRLITADNETGIYADLLTK